MKETPIEFLRKKDFKFIRDIGQGGTGKTILIKDEIIDEFFVCKKYSPYYEEHRDLFFDNFLDEIKILHRLYHKNIVRVFNYYLYPDKKTGYILMEYIEGLNIRDYIKDNPHKINELFVQIVDGFCYLEQNNILHRDIRPENVLVSDDGLLKIIDFGFGKQMEYEDSFNKSISLNWRYSPPTDFENKIYNFKTEIYFVGKLFEELIIDNGIESFRYSSVLSLMIKSDFNFRIDSFSNINRSLISNVLDTFDFSYDEKAIYKLYANALCEILSEMQQGVIYITDIDKIIMSMDKIFSNSMLEDFIQNPNAITNCFLNGGYSFYPGKKMQFELFSKFLRFFRSLPIEKKKIVLNNLWQRFDAVKRAKIEEKDDLPF